MERYTVTQIERLRELRADDDELTREFASAGERNKAFLDLEKTLAKRSRNEIRDLLENRKVTRLRQVENTMAAWLMDEGFTEVKTPTIISRQALQKMSLEDDDPLLEQVFWLDRKHCLRPMLAPNLYVEMRELGRITQGPVKIYEMGSCFRKESQGSRHLNEFTMLNLVEFAQVEDGEQEEELKRLAMGAMDALGLSQEEYEIVTEESTVYGFTFDIEIGGMEVASGSFGPHFLDPAWDVYDTWVGIGFGMERLAMVLNKGENIKRYGRTLAFIDGEPLNI